MEAVHIVIKIATGVVIVPMGIILAQIWPWWTKTALPLQIVCGLVIVPYAGLVYVLTMWWEKF